MTCGETVEELELELAVDEEEDSIGLLPLLTGLTGFTGLTG